MDLLDIGHKLVVSFIPFLFALSFHEFSHGLVAKWRGDNTAEKMGRLTLDPLAHADMVGTFLLPIMAIVFSSPVGFGWAKPVPVDSRNLKNVRTDMFWIALAGPLSNVLLAFVGTGIMYFVIRSALLMQYQDSAVQFMATFIQINLVLAIFNMIPVNPLDGGKVLARFLPATWNYKLEQHQQILSFALLALFIFGAFKFILIPVRAIFMFLMGLIA